MACQNTNAIRRKIKNNGMNSDSIITPIGSPLTSDDLNVLDNISGFRGLGKENWGGDGWLGCKCAKVNNKKDKKGAVCSTNYNQGGDTDKWCYVKKGTCEDGVKTEHKFNKIKGKNVIYEVSKLACLPRPAVTPMRRDVYADEEAEVPATSKNYSENDFKDMIKKWK